MEKLVEGQVLWWVSESYQNRDTREVKILKVGRKWAELSNRYRIDVKTLVADGKGYSSPGRCFLSKEIWEEKVATERAWWMFKNDLGHLPPSGVTAADIEAIRKILGLGAV